MNCNTRFSCGDVVVKIFQAPTKTWEPCGFCGADGRIQGADGKWKPCPECYGSKGHNKYGSAAWQASDETLTIGQVRFEFTGEWEGSSSEFDNYGAQKEELEVQYMCRETGIGSGSLHYERDLFRTKEEAQKEADWRNAQAAKDAAHAS